jgi:hypothetical protein
VNDTQDIADFPDRFVYVCTATRAQTVNTTPLMQAPRGALAGLVIVQALSDPKSGGASAQEQSHANPNELQVLGRRLGLKESHIRVIKGHASRFDGFGEVLARAGEMARAANAEILFNITGGPVPAKFGPFLSYRPAPGAPALHLVYVSHSPFVVYLVSLAAERGIRQRPLPVTERQPFAGYLATWGISETDSHARQADAERHRAAANAANRFFAMATRSGKLSPLEKLCARAVADGSLPFREKNPAAARSLLDQDLIDGVHGLRVEGDTVVADEVFGWWFLGGKWLETLLFNRLERRFAGRNDVDVLCGVRFQLAEGDNSGKRDLGDIDVAVYAGGQLFAAEAKSGRAEKGINIATRQLANIRQHLLGNGGGTWLVVPRMRPEWPAVANAIRAGEKTSTRVLAGPRAVEVAVDEIAAAAEAALAAP